MTATADQIAVDLADLDSGLGGDETGIRHHVLEDDRSDASVVLHVLEELYQHLGHAELTADALRSDLSETP